MAAYRRVYDSRRLQADCQEPESAPEPYARQSSIDYWNQLRNPTLGSRVWTTFTCLGLTHNTCLIVLPYSYVPQAKVQWPRPVSDWQLIRSDWHLFVYIHLPITAPTQFRAISHHG